MSTTSNDRYHEAIRGTLAQGAGDSPDATAIAEAALDTWRRVADRLTPVIGARGVDALFSRSLHVTSKTFPWLAVAGDDGSHAALLTGLKARLADQETAAAAEASHALLVNFTELLATLIGASLTGRLLAPVWLLSPPEPEQESAPCILATAFLAEGARRGEPGVIVAFEQTPSQSRTRTIDEMVRAGHVDLINTRSLDLSIDEIVQRLIDLIQQMKATRVVIDSLSGFELAVAPTFREDFRESLFRMVAVLAGLGVTVLLTSELEDRYTDLRFSPYGSAFLTDAIIVQRYIEIESRLKRIMAVVKVRGSAHNNELRQFEITDEGIVIGDPIPDYEGLLGGQPMRKPISGTGA